MRSAIIAILFVSAVCAFEIQPEDLRFIVDVRGANITCPANCGNPDSKYCVWNPLIQDTCALTFPNEKRRADIQCPCGWSTAPCVFDPKSGQYVCSCKKANADGSCGTKKECPCGYSTDPCVFDAKTGQYICSCKKPNADGSCETKKECPCGYSTDPCVFDRKLFGGQHPPLPVWPPRLYNSGLGQTVLGKFWWSVDSDLDSSLYSDLDSSDWE
ncbi:hypothetical protein PROFUN_08640 [Planoprotostelium fungivorum]|uniref:EGF-like domain-containing protein n=1 Tax=Planoprotostelium fungivorum TaxID=1890364 RepID=A0A2P6NJ26_9EUKA|nr:hypothetical protein PROFUN_08640 [Planoprotostelium fungivorum]